MTSKCLVLTLSRLRYNRQFDHLFLRKPSPLPGNPRQANRRNRPHLRRSKRPRPHGTVILRRLSQIPLHHRFPCKPSTFPLQTSQKPQSLLRPEKSFFLDSSAEKYEVLRIYPIVLPIGRITLNPQSITLPPSASLPSYATTPSTSILPAHCGVIVNNTAIHHNPRFWPSPHVLAPERWLFPHPNLYDPLSRPGERSEAPGELHTPDKGTFMTFSEGSRACLGKRFAQAEYVCFFAHVLRNYRLVLGEGRCREGGAAGPRWDSRDEVEKRFRRRCAGSPVTLAPPEDVRILLVRR